MDDLSTKDFDKMENSMEKVLKCSKTRHEELLFAKVDLKMESNMVSRIRSSIPMDLNIMVKFKEGRNMEKVNLLIKKEMYIKDFEAMIK